MQYGLRWVWLVAAAVVAAGCGGSGGTLPGAGDEVVNEAPVDDRGGDGAAGGSGVETYGAGYDGVGGSQMAGGVDGNMNGAAGGLDDPASPLSQRVIYFAYDSAEVSPEGREILAAHADYLAMNSGVTLVLEGHGDERGSREYNIALGERRALAVRTLLLFLGAVESQLQTVSYGEEKPVALGHDEASWRLNRRVELIYGASGR